MPPVETRLCMGEHLWPIKITLTDRSEMTYMMLLGRETMSDKILVYPSAKFLFSC